MAPSPLPKFVYKIVPSAPPSPIPDEYPLSDLDKADGFVHLSTADQASCPFSSIGDSLRKDKVTYENGDGCPHLHGNFGAADVEDAKELSRKEGEDWKTASRNYSEWLI
ncbi:hypothetical protein KJ359_012939 [Pestalotiopsis sp. 9143b]|nr:hypothetical protein KJ359_012939 [Pestalotiopsis sp. 9143b]